MARGRDASRDRDGQQDGTPMRVLALDRSGGTRARCAGADGIPMTVETALLDPLEPGAIVLVQAGIALVRLDTEWAP
ncbi:MAG: HypC/HybG/HupF family hydrogenase formation chaperone [Actinobacteria bacterium]|nr:HypC/HybG/HupF family hydrogenase formation chaperone [Actinomycetota bacterium]